MNDEELEQNILYLKKNINKNNKRFSFVNKTKEILQEFKFFKDIIMNFPDKCNSILTEITSELNIKKYDKKDVIFDNSIKTVNEIYIIFLGEIKVTNYYVSEEEYKDNENVNNELIIKKGEIFEKNIIMKKFGINKKFNENGELSEDENCYFRIISKSKSFIGSLSDKNYFHILEKYNTKERLEKIYFLQKIDYLPNEDNFIDRFQTLLIKKCFAKNSIICEQKEQLKLIYLIHSGLVRLSRVFNKKISCKLDHDVLIGDLINERFSSSRMFELKGNYDEKEKLILVDIGEREIIGGIELCKNLNNYIFKVECLKDTVLYGISINEFKNVLKIWNSKGFYDKINNQIYFLRNRLSNLKSFSKEKRRLDDYSLSQNKFIKLYKKGHPLNKKAKEYIKKYTRPFNFDKIIKSKELKTIDTKYYKVIDIKKFKESIKNEKKKNMNRKSIPFITNLIDENFSQDIRTKKGKFKTTIINKKYSNKQPNNNLSSITKENIKINKDKKTKTIKSNNNLKISSNSISNNNFLEKTKKIMNRRRLNSCKLENKMNLKMSQNSNEQSSNRKDNSNSISLMKVFSSKNNLKKNSCNISIDSFKNRSIGSKLKDSSSLLNKYLMSRKNLHLIVEKIRKFSQPSINRKKLTFPYGIQEIFENNINMLNKFSNNSLIKDDFLPNKRKRKNRTLILYKKNNMKNKVQF